jgi:hypothetical protein
LIDVGLPARPLEQRLASVGSGWDRVGAALLTHTHGDHFDDSAMQAMARRRIVLICHEGHRPALASRPGFAALEGAGLVRTYDERPFLTPTGHRVEPLGLRHDSGPTFGFRVEARGERRSRWVGLGYLADSGCWSAEAAEILADVDLLGVEFNYDPDMQRQSGRPWVLIRRIMGERGHLSNEQGADLVAAVAERSGRGALRHVVLLHLSEECNRPELAVRRAREALRRTGRRATVHAATQEVAHPNVWVRPGRKGAAPTAGGFPWEAA